eukprot:6284264-Prorocentrum_lima.AAC.1
MARETLAIAQQISGRVLKAIQIKAPRIEWRLVSSSCVALSVFVSIGLVLLLGNDSGPPGVFLGL